MTMRLSTEQSPTTVSRGHGPAIDLISSAAAACISFELVSIGGVTITGSPFLAAFQSQ